MAVSPAVGQPYQLQECCRYLGSEEGLSNNVVRPLGSSTTTVHLSSIKTFVVLWTSWAVQLQSGAHHPNDVVNFWFAGSSNPTLHSAAYNVPLHWSHQRIVCSRNAVHRVSWTIDREYFRATSKNTKILRSNVTVPCHQCGVFHWDDTKGFRRQPRPKF